MRRIYKEIWVARCRLVQDWEKTVSITRKAKRKTNSKKLKKKKGRKKETLPNKHGKESNKKEEAEKSQGAIIDVAKKEILSWIKGGQRAV